MTIPDRSISSPGAIAATIVVIVSGGGVFLILPVFVGALVDSGGLSVAQAGAVASADLAGIFAASIAALAWVRRAGWRRVALFSLACMLPGNIACMWVDAFVPLLVLRGLLGFAAGNLMAIGMAHLARVAKPDRAFALAIAAQVAFSTAALWTMPVAVQSWGLGSLFGLLALLSTIGLLAATRLVRGTEPLAAEPFPKAAGDFHVFVPLCANTVFFIAQSSVWAFLERFATQAGLAPEAVGTMLAVSVSLALAGPLAASLIADRYGRAIPLAVVAVGQMATLWILQGPITAGSFLLAATAFQIFWNFAIPYIVAIVAALDRARRYIVLVTPFQAAGIALGPVLAGNLAGNGELSAVTVLGGAAILASVAMLIPYTLGHRQGRADERVYRTGRGQSG